MLLCGIDRFGGEFFQGWRRYSFWLLGGFHRGYLVWDSDFVFFVRCLNCVKDPAGFSDVGGGVSEGKAVLCDDYGVRVLGTRVV